MNNIINYRAISNQYLKENTELVRLLEMNQKTYDDLYLELTNLKMAINRMPKETQIEIKRLYDLIILEDKIRSNEF